MRLLLHAMRANDTCSLRALSWFTLSVRPALLRCGSLDMYSGSVTTALTSLANESAWLTYASCSTDRACGLCCASAEETGGRLFGDEPLIIRTNWRASSSFSAVAPEASNVRITLAAKRGN